MDCFITTVRNLMGVNRNVVVSTDMLRNLEINPDDFGREAEKMNRDSNGEFSFKKINQSPTDQDKFSIQINKRK